MSKKFWTEKMVVEEIQSAIKALNINRMPSKSELEMLYGDCALTNRITKTGGFYFWAKKLGLAVKNFETQCGYEVENMIAKILESMGHECKLTSVRHPYDILVDGCVKIDVKSARKTKVRGSDVYSFGLGKKQQTCDAYIAVCLGEDDIEKIYVIPAHIMTGKQQLCLGAGQSKYDIYIDRWDVVEKFIAAFEQIA